MYMQRKGLLFSHTALAYVLSAVSFVQNEKGSPAEAAVKMHLNNTSAQESKPVTATYYTMHFISHLKLKEHGVHSA